MYEIECDPVELTEKFLEIEAELEAKIDARLKNHSRGLGFCHKYWNVKKEILKNDYGIDWQSPPHLMTRKLTGIEFIVSEND